MEEVKWCRLCHGFGVRATPKDYKRWRDAVNIFTARIAKKSNNEKLIAAHVLNFTKGLTKGRPECSFCGGTGGWTKPKK